MNAEKTEMSPQMMLAAMNAVSSGIVIVDGESRIIYINDAYTRILDVPRQKVMHKQISVIEPGAMILDVLRDRKPRYRRPVEVKTRGKRILVTITPITENGKFSGAVSVFEDITELSLSHEELEKTQRLSRSIFKAAAQENAGISPAFSHAVGNHPNFLRCLRLAELVAPTDATVLVEGESGTGKEVIVNAILRISGKRQKPFVNINCSAIPENLLESELFGYAPGSFTGAAKGGKAGKFELAHGGTIFLDEIGELPLFMQAKLLRVLQSGEIQKIGSQTMEKVDVRVIAATNRKLKEMVQAGTFREDLYFRLNTFTIVIPPLRERGRDATVLAKYFLRKFAEKYGKKLMLAPETSECILRYEWPGNVRQLESCMEYAAIVCRGSVVTPECLPEEMRLHGTPSQGREAEPAGRLKADIAALERETMIRILGETGGNKTKAMEKLGISRRTFYKKWKQYGLNKHIFTK